MANLNLPLLPPGASLVDDQGRASSQFTQYWQQFKGAIEGAINGIAGVLAAALAAQGSADLAAAAAAAAQTTASGASTAAGTAQTTASAAASAAATAQTTANGKLSQATADGLYVHQDLGPAWAAPSGTLSRAAYAAYVSPTISNPPTQAEMQAVSDALQALSRAMVGVITDLKANGALSS